MTKASQQQSQRYEKMAKKVAPPRPVLRNAILAFLIGGGIAAVGQLVLNFYTGLGMTTKGAGPLTAATMIFLGALFTGLGLYDELVSLAGMGAALPVTGFANSIVAPAMEFKREGFVLGVGARMFQVAGPVIVYGLLMSVIVGLARVAMRIL